MLHASEKRARPKGLGPEDFEIDKMAFNTAEGDACIAPDGAGGTKKEAPGGCLFFRSSKMLAESFAMPKDDKAEQALDRSPSAASVRALRALFSISLSGACDLATTFLLDKSFCKSSHKI